MQRANGGCHCGNIHVDMGLTRALDTYNPRTCDCDFCCKHGASFVSDPQGSLAIRIKRYADFGEYRQGAGLAEFLICRNCGVLVGVIYHRGDRLYGAVNANAIEVRQLFGAALIVSPKKLADTEKMRRWQEVWFSNVKLVTDAT